MDQSEEPNATTREAARLIGMSESTLRGWRCIGFGPPWYKFRGAVRYKIADVEKFIHESKRIPSVRAITEEHLVSIQTKR